MVAGEYYRDHPGRAADRWGQFEDRGGAALVYDPEGNNGRSSWSPSSDSRQSAARPGQRPPRVDGPAGFFKNGPAPGPTDVNEGVDRVMDQYQGLVSADRPATAFCLMASLAEEIATLPFVPGHHAAWIMDGIRSASDRMLEKHRQGAAPDGKSWLDAAQLEMLETVNKIQPAGDPTGDIAKLNQLLASSKASFCALGEREKPR
jgi:hypothetical protein